MCDVCGRTFAWRKKWERDWASVRYCSNACKRRGRKPIDEEIERAILALCRQRGAPKTICPSEAAKAVGRSGGSSDDDGWREWMEPVRMAARRLAHGGAIEITQRGKRVDPDAAKGAIRLRLPLR